MGFTSLILLADPKSLEMNSPQRGMIRALSSLAAGWNVLNVPKMLSAVKNRKREGARGAVRDCGCIPKKLVVLRLHSKKRDFDLIRYLLGTSRQWA
jgi:hypothetical protein